MHSRMVFSLCVVLALAAVAFPWNSQAQENSPEPEPIPSEKWPEAPAELVSAYIKSVKTSPRFQFADALRRDKIEAEVDKWRSGAGVETQVKWQSYLLFHLSDDMRAPYLADKSRWNIDTRDVYDAMGVREYLVLVDVAAERDSGYRVSVAALKELDVSFLDSIEIKNPLNRLIGKYSVQNEPLSTVVAALCKEAAGGRGNVDYVVRSDPGSPVLISMQMAGRSVFECLLFAARSVGWDVFVNPEISNREEPQPDLRAHDSGVRWDDAMDTWTNRELLNMRDQIQPPIVTPQDALRECFQGELKSALSARYAVMLKPAKKD
jgi:hypothetical protein